MLAYLHKHSVDYVIVHKLDRLARSRSDDIAITQEIRDTGARLISSTEGIDASPNGTLLHGIMASIAEFYSRKLAQEVKKGMRQKVIQGGTPSRAPIGYLNVRQQAEDGREFRTVAIDTERHRMLRGRSRHMQPANGASLSSWLSSIGGAYEHALPRLGRLRYHSHEL